MSKPLLGIFGGTFDPVHQGHLGAVTQIAEKIEFDSILWVVSAKPPHKDQVRAAAQDRLNMLELALEPYSNWQASDIEIQRHAPSYSFDTLTALRERYPDHQLVMLIGGDSLETLPSWYRYPELLDLAHWVVMHRPSYSLKVPERLKPRLVDHVLDLVKAQPDDQIESKLWIHENSDFKVSSTQLRQALSVNEETKATKQLITEQLPKAVLNYIQQQQLYKIGSMLPEKVKNEVVEALEDIKGHDISVLDIAEVSGFADYMVVVSGTSDTHVRAMAREASDRLRKQGVKPLNEDGADLGEWVLVDFGDVVLHVMRPEVRSYYDLETLWDADARAKIEQAREQTGDDASGGASTSTQAD